MRVLACENVGLQLHRTCLLWFSMISRTLSEYQMLFYVLMDTRH